jgi:translation initiation factor 1A
VSCIQGGKNRRRGKNENEAEKRELVFRDEGQGQSPCIPRRDEGETDGVEDWVEYAQVTKMLGNGKVEAMCFDGEKRLAHIRGKMRKKVSTTTTLLGGDEMEGGRG